MASAYRTGPAARIRHVSCHRWALIPSAVRPFIVFLVTLAELLSLSGCHPSLKLTPQEAEGKHLYQARCAHCHEDNDLALKKVPPDLHDVFKRITLPSGVPATDAQVRHVVLDGKGMMPSFTGRFNEAQMSALLAYLHTGLR